MSGALHSTRCERKDTVAHLRDQNVTILYENGVELTLFCLGESESFKVMFLKKNSKMITSMDSGNNSESCQQDS